MSTPTPGLSAHPVRAVIARIDAAIETGASRREFLALVDSARDALHAPLAAAYQDDYYAKLVCLKLSNYLVAKLEHRQRLVHLVSRPVTLMVDPANSCQLGCPGCVHSKNDAFTKAIEWPGGVMRVHTFEALLAEHGPFALNTVLYNYGEPLLNKRAAEFVEAAHRHGMSTHLSTNLSLRFDVERFVAAGPDVVILSIDGLTQETYGRFRKGGDLELVLDNVRRMVAEKQRLGATRPRLIWRFFPFEHNVHEVDGVMAAAREIGVDQLIIGNPFDVSNDDPGVRLVPCDKKGRYVLRELPATPNPPLQSLVARDPRVEALFAEGWSARAAGLPDEQAHRDAGTCIWLYYNVTADAAGRVMPCCISPTKRKPLVYGDLDEGIADLANLPDFRESRLAFADRAAFEAQRDRPRSKSEPWCASCPRRPPLTYDPAAGAHDFVALDPRNATGGMPDLWWSLGKWS